MQSTRITVADPTRPPFSRRIRIGWPRVGKNPVLLLCIVVIGLVVICAAAPGLLAPYAPEKLAAGDLLDGPSAAHPLGTDEFGRDILSRIIHGARIELIVSVAGVALAVALGVPLGLFAGYRGGLIDSVIMRVQDAMLAFPGILFAILIVAGLGSSARSIVLTVGIVFFPRFARLVRGSVLALKEQDFVLASLAGGATERRIMTRHILPNCLAPILVQITLAMAVAILMEAGLSYLGLGIQPPTATWGTMLQRAQTYPAQAPWYVLAPGFCIFLLVLSLNVVGDYLRDSLDPRLRGV
ncbi:MAG: ABC transporter permease [Thermomicrobiales bacterium]